MSASDQRPILLVGAGGQIGRRLAPALLALGPVGTVTRADVDLERPDDIRRMVRATQPRLFVNAAAYTAVDAAESDAARARAVNADAAEVLAIEAASMGAAIIHLSTNYVFDGRQAQAYREDDEPHPLGVYGETKLAGERAVAAANDAHAIVRTAAVYDSTGANFLVRIRELAREREELRVVDDQYVAPTPATIVADGVAAIARRMLSGDAHACGIVHLTTRGAASWYEFALRVLAADPDRARHRCRSVLAVTSAEYPSAARRPANGILDTAKFESRFGMTLPTWEEAFTAFQAKDGA